MHHLAGLQLFAAQADNQCLAAQVGVARQVAHGADRDVGVACVDGHAAAIAVGNGHHVIDVGVLGQQLAANALDRMVQHAGHALHGGGDAEDVAGADGAVGIAIAFEGIAFKRRQGLGYRVGHGQAVKRWRRGHFQLGFLDPTALHQVLLGVADNLAITDNLGALGNVDQGHLMALRDAFNHRQAIGEATAFCHALVVHHHHDIVIRVQAHVARRVGMFDQLHGLALLVQAESGGLLPGRQEAFLLNDGFPPVWHRRRAHSRRCFWLHLRAVPHA
ncbi:hypothetical protein D9M71_334500 [compost metagenome]